MKKLMVTILSFVVIAAMVSVFSCGTTNPEEPQPTAVPTNTPGPLAEYRFATYVEGWYVSGGNEIALSSLSHDATLGKTADGCLSATTDFYADDPQKHKGNIEKELPAYWNLTGKTISVWINVPQAMADFVSYNAQIYIKNDGTGGWGCSYGGWTNLYSTGWIEVTAAVNTMVGSADKTKVKFIGVQILKHKNIDDPEYDSRGEQILFDDIVIQ